MLLAIVKGFRSQLAQSFRRWEGSRGFYEGGIEILAASVNGKW